MVIDEHNCCLFTKNMKIDILVAVSLRRLENHIVHTYMYTHWCRELHQAYFWCFVYLVTVHTKAFYFISWCWTHNWALFLPSPLEGGVLSKSKAVSGQGDSRWIVLIFVLFMLLTVQSQIQYITDLLIHLHKWIVWSNGMEISGQIMHLSPCTD